MKFSNVLYQFVTSFVSFQSISYILVAILFFFIVFDKQVYEKWYMEDEQIYVAAS